MVNSFPYSPKGGYSSLLCTPGGSAPPCYVPQGGVSLSGVYLSGWGIPFRCVPLMVGIPPVILHKVGILPVILPKVGYPCLNPQVGYPRLNLSGGYSSLLYP